LILLAVTRSFRESAGRFHFLGVAEDLTIGSATVEREIISVSLKNVTAKNCEDLGGLCLEVHDRFSFILESKMVSKPAIMKCEKSQCVKSSWGLVSST
jgi:hypothetical protein